MALPPALMRVPRRPHGTAPSLRLVSAVPPDSVARSRLTYSQSSRNAQSSRKSLTGLSKGPGGSPARSENQHVAAATPLTPLQKLAARITAHADALATCPPSASDAEAEAEADADSKQHKHSHESTETLHHHHHHQHQHHHHLAPPPTRAPVDSLAEQTGLRDALAEAAILATNARDFVPELAVRNNQFACIRWLCHFRVPEALPLPPSRRRHHANDQGHDDDSSSRSSCSRQQSSPPAAVVPYATIAQKTGVPLHQLRSIARMAMLAGFLAEPTPEHLAHSPLSAALARDPDLLEWARFVTGTSAPMVAHMVEATERWGGDRSLGRTAYAAAWGGAATEELPLFAHVAADPDLQARYAAYMRVMMQSEGMALRHLLDGWEGGWSALAARRGVLVDVGGSKGHVSMGIATRFPGIRVVVQDQEKVVAGLELELQLEPPAMGESSDAGPQLTFQGHDFFLPQPGRPRGFESKADGDVYLLRQILHDWNDDESCKILRNLAVALEAAGPKSRLIVMDTVLPDPGQVSRSEEAVLRVRDLTMQQAHNAHERNRAEWEELFAKAHPKFRIRQVIQPRKSLMAIIEIGLE